MRSARVCVIQGKSRMMGWRTVQGLCEGCVWRMRETEKDLPVRREATTALARGASKVAV